MEEVADSIIRNRLLFFVGGNTPSFAEDYIDATLNCSSQTPMIPLIDEDDAAIYFLSGTIGFPNAILHNQTKDDIFLCIPPLYHPGAKMHWFGSFLVGSKGVILISQIINMILIMVLVNLLDLVPYI